MRLRTIVIDCRSKECAGVVVRGLSSHVVEKSLEEFSSVCGGCSLR